MGRPGLHNHPKFRRLVHVLGEPASHVRGYLECLWEVAYEAGNAVIGDAVDVSLACGFPGPPEKITDALLGAGGPGRIGLIEQTDTGCYQIHDLFDHAPAYVTQRAKREDERKKAKACLQCGSTFRSAEEHA